VSFFFLDSEIFDVDHGSHYDYDLDYDYLKAVSPMPFLVTHGEYNLAFDDHSDHNCSIHLYLEVLGSFWTSDQIRYN